MPPIGSIASLNASLTVAMFDARSATDWVPTKPAATKQQFSGHPAEIMRGLAKGEAVTSVDVGGSSGFAFELEGKSGRIEVYRLADGTLALIAPPRSFWKSTDADALFDQMLGGVADDADEVGELELSSGKLAIVYLWLKKVGLARELAATVPDDGAIEFGDGYGEGNGGLIVAMPQGRYRLLRHEVAAPWDADLALVAMYLAV